MVPTGVSQVSARLKEVRRMVRKGSGKGSMRMGHESQEHGSKVCGAKELRVESED